MQADNRVPQKDKDAKGKGNGPRENGSKGKGPKRVKKTETEGGNSDGEEGAKVGEKRTHKKKEKSGQVQQPVLNRR